MTSRPRILQVVTSTDRRGAETFAFDLYEELRSRGWDTEIWALARGRSDSTLPIPALGTAPLSLRTYAVLRSRAVSRGGLVIAHGSSTLPACALGLLGTHVPFVYRNIGTPEDWLTTRRRSIQTQFFLRRAAGVAALWAGSAATIERDLRVPPDRISIIGNGRRAADYPPVTAEERRSARAAAAIDPTTNVVACIGSLSSEKGVEVAIEALARLPESWVLVIAGHGPERAALERLAATQAPGRVRFLGALPTSRQAMALADVVVVPSHTEGLSGVAIEAGLAGLPVVATDVGGSRSIVIDGSTGFLVPRGEPGRLADSVVEAMRARAALGHAARQHCLRHFEFDAIVALWEDLLLNSSAR